MKKLKIITTSEKAKRFYSDLSQELKLNNLFKYGFTQDTPLFITELSDNKPATINEFEELMGKNNLNYLFFIELDREKAKERYNHFWVDSERKYFVYKNGSRFECWINYAKGQHSKIGDFWRKTDQEKARVCAKNVFAIYQQSQAETIKAKREARETAKSGDLIRYKNISFNFVSYRYSDSPIDKTDFIRVGGIKAESYKRNQIKCFATYGYNEKLPTNTTSQDIKNIYFDKNGYYVYKKIAELKSRAETLKEQRLKAILEATNCEEQKNQVNELRNKLFKELERLNDFLTLQLKEATNCDLFYLKHRISPTIEQIKNCNDFLKRLNKKDFASNTEMLKQLNELKESITDTFFYNQSYFDLSEQEKERKKWNEQKSEKLTAIYYNYLIIKNGVRVLDVEKARAKL